MIKKWIVLLLALNLVCTPVFGEDDFYQYQIEKPEALVLSSEGDFVAIEVSPEVYKNAKSDLGDLRIINQEGRETPYVFLNPEAPETVSAEATLELGRAVSKREKDRDVYDFAIATTASKEVFLRGLTLIDQGNGPYLHQFQVWGSHDGTSYEVFMEADIYSVEGHQKNLIAFPSLKNYKFYRVTTKKGTGALAVFKAIGHLVSKGSAPVHNTVLLSESGVIALPYQRTEKEQKTHLLIAGIKKLPLIGMKLRGNGAYSRSTEVDMIQGEERVQVLTGVLSKYNIEGQGEVTPTLSMGTLKPLNDERDTLEIIIDNKSDAPIDIKGIDLIYKKDYLAFKMMPGATYTLMYGKQSFEAPQYDLSDIEADIDQKIIGVIELKGKPDQGIVLQSKDTSDETTSKILLNGTIIFAAILLAFAAFQAMKRGKQS